MVGRRIWHLTIAAVTPGMGQRPGCTSFRPESGHRWECIGRLSTQRKYRNALALPDCDLPAKTPEAG